MGWVLQIEVRLGVGTCRMDVRGVGFANRLRTRVDIMNQASNRFGYAPNVIGRRNRHEYGLGIVDLGSMLSDSSQTRAGRGWSIQ